MTKEEAERFFKLHGDDLLSNPGTSHFTIEELYQAFYRRLFDEGATMKHRHRIAEDE